MSVARLDAPAAADEVEGFLEPDEYALLHELAARVDHGCIVEIGSYRGRSTVALAQGALAGGALAGEALAGGAAPLYAIEPHDEFVGELGGVFGPADRAAFFDNMVRAGVVEHVHLVNLPSAEVAPGWSREVALLWIDGDHRYDAVRADLDAWAPHLTADAVVAFHDAATPGLGPAQVVAEEVAAGRFERVGAVGQIVVLRRLAFRSPAAPLVSAPPDFVGVGAQKCGTSWWYSLIAAHPEVHDPAGFDKEARFFCGDGPYDADAYRRLFARPPGLVAGEWTPDYLWTPGGIGGLRRAAPDAKLLLLVRDPVERFASGLAHLLMYDEPIHRRALRKTYRAGLYGLQARRLLRQFPREQVLLLQYERCVAHPEDELARTYAFLGLDTTFAPPSPARPVHETTVEKPILPPRFRARLAQRYRRDAARLAALFPELDLGLWRSLS